MHGPDNYMSRAWLSLSHWLFPIDIGISLTFGWEVAHTMDKSPVNHRADTKTQTIIHTHIHTYRNFLPTNLTCMSLDWRRESVHHGKTHAGTKKTHKLHTERSPADRKFWTENVLIFYWVEITSDLAANKSCWKKASMIKKIKKSMLDNIFKLI